MELKAFDLAGERKVGHWVFDPPAALRHWRSGMLLDCYVFQLPWQEPPSEALKSVVLRWSFQPLTGEEFTGEKVLRFTTGLSP